MIDLIIFYSVFCFFIQVGYCIAIRKQGDATPYFNLIFAPIITPIMIGVHYGKI